MKIKNPMDHDAQNVGKVWMGRKKIPAAFEVMPSHVFHGPVRCLILLVVVFFKKELEKINCHEIAVVELKACK